METMSLSFSVISKDHITVLPHVMLLTNSLELLHSHQLSSIHYSASLHPDKSCFVVGGEDFKLRKCDFTSGSELGKSRTPFIFILMLFLL